MSVVEQKESYALSHRQGLGGSDCASILGLSPWRTPIETWEAKVYPERVEDIDKDCLRWGVLLEPVIRQEYARKFGVEVIAPNRLGELFPNSRAWQDSTIIVGRFPWMLGMPDGFMPSVQSGLEIKTASRRSDEWGNENSEDVPVQYLLQCVWYMALTETPAWNIAVLFSGSDLRQFRITRDMDLERDTIEACRHFWEEYVLKGIEPPIDETESYSRYLARKFSLNTGTVIKDPGPEIIDWTVKMKEAEEAEKKAAADKQLANNNLRALIGDAQKAITPLGSVGWVRPKEGESTDWKAAAERLSALYEDARSADAIAAADVIKEATTPEQRSSYLRAWWRRSKVEEFSDVNDF